jgi:hypothetical protein
MPRDSDLLTIIRLSGEESMKKCFFAAVLAVLGTGAVAQQAQAPAPRPELSWVAPQVPEVQRVFDVLAGQWKTTERFEANQFLKNGATGSGSFSIRKGPGGNSIVLDYTSQSSMGRYSSERIIYWDRREGNYRAFYCDSLQPAGCGEAGTGRWEDKDLVFESMTQGSPGGALQMVQRFSNISRGGFTFSLDLIAQGKKERSLTIQARKARTNAKTILPDGTHSAHQTSIPSAKSQLQWVALRAPEVRLLSDAFVGNWNTNEKFEPDETHQNGASGTGAFSIRNGPGGNSLILEYVSRSSIGSYSSSRIIYWDNRKGEYRSFYCDSLQPIGCGEAGRGRLEGANLTLESMIHESGNTVPIKERFSNVSNSRFIFSLDLANHGKTERSLTIEARKSGVRP